MLIALVFAAGAVAQEPWQEVRSVEGKFKAEIPCETPRFKSEKIAGSSSVMTQTTYTCVGDGTAYIISFTDYSDPFVKVSSLKAEMEGFAKGFQGTVISQRMIFSNTGVEFQAKSDAGTATVRLFYVGNRMYGLVAVKAADVTLPLNSEKLFSSFVLAG